MNKVLIPRDASACLIMNDDNKYIMQRRDNKSDIFFPGRLGLFGGAIEKHESPRDAVVREIEEELSINFEPNRFQPCGELNLVIDKISLVRYFFSLKVSIKESRSMKVTEGIGLEELSGEELLKRHLTPYDEYFLFMKIHDRISNKR